MKIKNKKRWQKIQKDFSNAKSSDMNKAVLSYAKRWATKMEKEFKGTFDHKIAAKTKSEADIEELTNHMFCCAVHVLANVWIFGEELRQWHNIIRCNGDLSIAIKANMNNEILYS